MQIVKKPPLQAKTAKGLCLGLCPFRRYMFRLCTLHSSSSSDWLVPMNTYCGMCICELSLLLVLVWRACHDSKVFSQRILQFSLVLQIVSSMPMRVGSATVLNLCCTKSSPCYFLFSVFKYDSYFKSALSLKPSCALSCCISGMGFLRRRKCCK